eukprot:scaffold282_cov118-Isochrysis_galbana.AAC.2
MRGMLAPFSRLELDHLAQVSNALALVCIGLAEPADLGGEVAHLPFDVAEDRDRRLGRAGDLHTVGHRYMQFVGEAQP